MMWNYLCRACWSGPRPCCSTATPATRPGRAVALAETGDRPFFGTSAPFLLACRKAGVSARPTWPPCGRGVDRCAAPAEGFEWVYRGRRRRRAALVDQRGYRRVHGLRRRLPLVPVRAGRSPAAAWGRLVEAYDEAGRPVVGQGELVITAPCRRCRSGSGATTTASPLPSRLLRPIRVWPTATGSPCTPDGACVITGRSDDPQPGRRPHGHRRVSTRWSRPARGGRQPGGPPRGRSRAAAGDCCSWPPRRRPSTTLRPDQGGAAHRAVAPPRARPDPRGAGRPRTLSGKKLEVPVEGHPSAAPIPTGPPAGGSLANPDVEQGQPRFRAISL